MDSEFLPSLDGIKWTSDRTGADCEVYLGEGQGNVLEIVITETDGRPRKDFMQDTYTDRRSQRVSPVLVVALYNDGNAGVCGPSGEDPIYYKDLDSRQVERVCKAALEEPNRHAAERFLAESLQQLDEELPGISNQGLLSTHELRVGVPERDDWDSATSKAQNALADDPRELLRGLNYEVERLTDQSYILKHADKGNESAVAVFLRENESFEHAQDRFVGDSPVAYALEQAEKKNLDYVIGNDGDTLRLYTTNPEDGFGSRGQTDTYVEINTSLLADEKAGYLWLLFSANALQDDGSLQEIMERSKDYAASLGARLRERIYDEVVPDLAEAIAEARHIENPLVLV